MDSQKKYIQLYSKITDAVKAGDYVAGDKLPTELELAETYHVSRQTVRQALEKLEKEGFIFKVQGSGSYISEAVKQFTKTMRIAVITTYISTYIFPSILRGIEHVATNNRYSLLLSATNNSIAKEREILRTISADSVDGIIVEGTKTALPNPNLSFYRDLAEKNIPQVFFNGYYPELFEQNNDKILYVVTDDYKGAYSATRELIRKGHTKLGGIFKSDDIQGIRRFSGYIDALTEEEIPIDDKCIIWFNTENISSVEQQLSNSTLISDCTAIVCYNDEIATQLLTVLDHSVSTVSAIRSFDGTLPNNQKEMDFKSCVHPKEKLGQLAAEKLLGIISGSNEENAVMSWE